MAKKKTEPIVEEDIVEEEQPVEEPVVEEYDDAFKEELIQILEKAFLPNGTGLSQREAAMLFHWIRHQDEPQYAFVPEKYRRKN